MAKNSNPEGMCLEKRTDLAIEVRESFPQDSVEVEGVQLEKNSFAGGAIQLTKVSILNEHGAKQMGKPQGNYITLEFCGTDLLEQESKKQCLIREIAAVLREMRSNKCPGESNPCYFVTGLGNRFATPDALGPYVVEHIEVNRHLVEGEKQPVVCAVVPGVTAQTGLETGEILGGIIKQTKPDILFVIDALATRSVHRLCQTIQITDTGILPGAGVGNHRFPINEETMGIPVIAIGVPTVVEANTIVLETMEEVLQKEDFSDAEIHMFLQGISKQAINNLFVTPKDIEEQIREIGEIISRGMNHFASGGIESQIKS